MQRKIFIYVLRIFASLFLLLAFLLILAVRLSDKGDIVDRNSGWIILVFLVAIGVFIYSLLVSDGTTKGAYKKKTIDQLMNEIRKPDIDKLTRRKKVPGK